MLTQQFSLPSNLSVNLADKRKTKGLLSISFFVFTAWWKEGGLGVSVGKHILAV